MKHTSPVSTALASVVLLFTLSACTSPPTAAPTEQSTSASSSPWDGKWSGTGESTTGLPFDVNFTVQEGKITSLVYRFPGTDGLYCTSIEFTHIDEANQPQILDRKVSAQLGADVSLDISFTDDRSGKGKIITHWHDRQPTCNGDYEVAWKVSHQVETVQSSTTQNPNAPTASETLLQILIFGLSNGAVLALNAIGVTIIYGTVRTLNLAHGDVFALCSALVTSIVNLVGIRLDWSPYQIAASLMLVFFATILLGATLSMGVERFGFAPFRGHSRLAPLIATLGISFILFQGALVWRTYQGSWIPGEHRSVPGLPEVPTDGIPSFLPEINLVKSLELPFHVIIRFSDVFVIAAAFLLVGLANWFLQKTRAGKALRAVSQNQQAAQILGINVNRTIRRAFALGGAFAGAAAFIFALYYGRPFGSHGAQSGLFAFMAALLGGIGNPTGALISGMLIGVFSSLSDYYFAAQWTPVLLLLLLVGLFAWKPTGFSAADAADQTSVRDSIVLIVAGQGGPIKRWFLFPFVLLALIPLGFDSGQIILRIASIFILLALGLNLILGIAGMIDFGFAASFGVAAYFTAWFTSRYDFGLVLLAGAGLGAFLGWLKGGLARRLRSDFFAVATLAFGLLLRQIIVNIDGMGGIGGIAAPHILTLKLLSQTSRYYLVLGITVLAAFACQRWITSRSGRAWKALSDDETAALAAGVNVGAARSSALIIGSMLAGMAGVLYASTLSFVEPDMMAFHVSSMVLTMVILGGAGNITGAVIGAVAIILYDKVLIPQLADWLAMIWPANLNIGSVPDIRGASFFNFGIALYLTVWFRARRRS